jgi:hypothetical protein
MEPSLEPERKEKSVRRLEELLETVHRELLDLETDFQVRLRESIQDTENRLREQFNADLASRTKQAEEESRKANTRELLQRFEVEIQKLSIEFEERGRHAIAAAESAANLRVEQAQAETERVRQDLQREVELVTKKTETERQNLTAEIARLGEELNAARAAASSKAGLQEKEMEARLSDLAQQKTRLEEELREATNRWNEERTNLKAEFDKSRQQLILRFDIQVQELEQGFKASRLKEIADTEAAAEIRLRDAVANAREQAQQHEAQLQAAAKETLQNTTVQFEATIERLNRRISGLEEELAKAKEEERGKTPLSKELEVKLQDLTKEKQALAEEFNQARAAWGQERETLLTKQPVAAASGTREVTAGRTAELARVEKSLQEIAAKMENPSLDLAAEIRLNQERVQLENYLKGLRFS